MQILGKRSKILLIAVAIFMLAALGLSFALWDTEAVKASSGSLSQYANAKVGDIIEFGQYYQTGEKDSATGEYIKTPIEWLVVDKDERTGQLTLFSKYILAAGSYFGNWYYSKSNNTWQYYDTTLTGPTIYNQAYVESTVRAFMNNLERLDLGGDSFISGKGFMPSYTNSSIDTGLLSSVGFSNKRYWTGLNYDVAEDKALVDAGNNGLYKRYESNEIYYQRPIQNEEFKNRPATRGFYDEAFNLQEKSMIVPKVISGYTGYRWPDNAKSVMSKSYVEGAYDKVWLPSATELNVMQGHDEYGFVNDAWTNPSDEAGSTVFEYFKNFDKYGFSSVDVAIKAITTRFAEDAIRANYSIPVYGRTNAENQVLSVLEDINSEKNTTDYYWTRSALSNWYDSVRVILNTGRFRRRGTDNSHIGVRPCIIVKY